MTTLSLVEWQTRHAVPAEPTIATVLRSRFGARIEPSFERPVDGPQWDVTPVGIVGSIKQGPNQVVVRPKVAIENVLFLLSVGSGNDPWQAAEDSRLAQRPELTSAVAALFARLAHQAVSSGVLRGYREERSELATVRGRIDFATQLRRRPGLDLPLAVSYDEHDEDVLENRLLLAATSRLRAHASGTAAVATSLHRLSAVLSAVTPIHVSPASVPSVMWTRLNSHYRAAVELARTVLGGTSVDIDVGGTAALGMTLNMAKVYEDFVCNALTRGLVANGGGRTKLQARCVLDIDSSITMKPDLVWYGESGTPRAVIDAKYKREGSGGAAEADVYQLLAYCTALGLREGHLVYAEGPDASPPVRVVGGGPTIYVHSVDLAQPPRALMHDVALLSSRIAAAAGSA